MRKKSICCYYRSGYLLHAILLICIYSFTSLSQNSNWRIKISGFIQNPLNEWQYWYDEYPEWACNGLQDISLGFGVGIEYKISGNLGIEGLVSFIPTRLHSEVHRTSENRFAIPNESMLFIPAYISANYYIMKNIEWEISLGPLLGIGIFKEKKVRPEFGKSRLFEGKNDFLFGGQFGITRSINPDNLKIHILLQYMKTTYKVSELGTGALEQDLNFSVLTIGMGLTFLL